MKLYHGSYDFRPLAGIMVLIITMASLYEINQSISVPLRGLWFLSSPSVIFGTCGISVPLRGLWFLSMTSVHVSSIHVPISVPLRGLWFLSDEDSQDSDVQDANFRPLAGIMVLIKMNFETLLQKRKKNFRPLAGIMVLIFGLVPLDEEDRIKVISVPLRGLWFLSAPFIDGFMKPLKWHFAGRIIYFHHFSSFARK